MLVLTRKPNQQIRIGNDIVVTVVKVRGNTIRLGIEAPQDVRVMRSELEPQSDSESANSTETISLDVQPDSSTLSAEVDASSRIESNVASASIQFPNREGVSNRKLMKGTRHPGKTESGMPQQNVEDGPMCHRSSERPATLPQDVHLKMFADSPLATQVRSRMAGKTSGIA